MRKAVAAGSIVAAALVSVPSEALASVVADESDTQLVADGNDILVDDSMFADGNDTLHPPPAA